MVLVQDGELVVWKTKISAASLANNAGIDAVITNGKNPENIYDVIVGKSVGTLFVGKINGNN